MSDADWKKYLAQESDERRAQRYQQEQAAGVREGVVTQDEADAQNAANAAAAAAAAANENKDKKKEEEVKIVSTPETSKDVLSRWQAGNQVRRENMLDRKDHSNVNKNYRGLKKQSLANWRAAGRVDADGNKVTRKEAKAGFGLNEGQSVAYEYAKANRKNRGGGIGDFNTTRDSKGNLVITGSKNDAYRNTSGRAKGTNVVTGGGDASTVENLIALRDSGHELSQVELDRIDTHLGVSKPNSHKNQTVKSTFKQTDLLDASGNFIKRLDAGSRSNALVPFENKPVKIKNTITKTLTGMKNTKAKGKWGTMSKVLGGIGLGVIGTLGLSGGKKEEETTVTPPPEPKKTKSWDQAYIDRDKKVYGGDYYDNSSTGKSNYIKEAKRQKGIHATTGKWDWKNAPNRADVKKPVVKPSVKPERGITPNNIASVSTNVSDDFKKKTDKMISDVVVPTSFDTPKTKTKKQTKAENKISRLEGRKTTARRDIRIAKQKDKAAGMSQGDVSARKQQRKFLSKNKPAIDKAITAVSGVQSNIDPISAVNSLKSREAELKKASGFTQKGWKGYQK